MYILGDVAINELAQFISMFSSRGAQVRAQHGSLSS